jgi:hypothetical protein
VLSAPWVTLSLLTGCFILLRLPTLLLRREFNLDESQMLAQGMKFLIDPRPWLGADPKTSGPLNSYIISAILLTGARPSFVLVHVLAVALVCLQLILAYLTLRRMASQRLAVLGTLLMVLLYGLATSLDYLHYSSELLPTVVITAGFYCFVLWLDHAKPRSRVGSAILLFLAGLWLGIAPWCKLQAGPIALSLGIVMTLAVFIKHDAKAGSSSRLTDLIGLLAGALAPTLVMLAILVSCGAFSDFWNSYILGNLVWAGPLHLKHFLGHFLLIGVSAPLITPVFLALLGVRLLLTASGSTPTRELSVSERRLIFWSLLVYMAVGTLCVCRTFFAFHHYTILLVPPLIYLAVVPDSILWPWRTPAKHWNSRAMVTVGLVLVFLPLALGIARYADMLQLAYGASRSSRVAVQATTQTTVLPTMPSDFAGKLKFIATCPLCAVWPANWPLDETDSCPRCRIWPVRWHSNDSSQRISAVVQSLQRMYPVRTLEIWGWTPGVYVLTGIPHSTRDSVADFSITKSPMQNFFLARFRQDMLEKQPDIFVDAATPNAFMWTWTEDVGYESDPLLRKFIDSNYVLTRQLSLVPDVRPVRFYVRRDLLSESQLSRHVSTSSLSEP